MSDHANFALDRQSNIRLFERLANPHMLDDRRLEEVKQITIPDMPAFRMPRGMTLEREDSQVPTEIDESRAQSENSRRYSQSSRNSRGSSNQSPRNSESPRNSATSGNSRRSSPRESEPEDHNDRENDDDDENTPHFPPPEPRLSARSTGSNRIDRKHHRFQPFDDDLLPPTRPPVFPQADDELQRLRSRMEAPVPSLFAMREDQRQREEQRQRGRDNNEEFRQRSIDPGPSGYDEMFRKICQMRKRNVGGNGNGGVSNGEYRPLQDPDYAEKRELLIKLDELRTLGFNVPKMDPAMPLEDLQTEITRRTLSMGTVETVDTVVGWICSAATVLETVNNMAGPFLPMENYAQSVREGTQTPRFKYALYQLVLRYQGRNAGSPWRVVLIVLLAPLIQGALIKLVQWLMKGRINVSPGMIGTGLKTLFSMGKKEDPNKGVPAGIPGISPDIKPPMQPNAGAATPAAAKSSNPFASFFKTAAQAATPAPTLPPTSNAMPADGPVTRPRRPRLQRPNEINGTESEVGVVTAEQLKSV